MSSNSKFVQHINKIFKQLSTQLDTQNLLFIYKTGNVNIKEGANFTEIRLLFSVLESITSRINSMIELVQKSFLRQINEYKNIDYWELLKTINLYSLKRRCERYIHIHMENPKKSCSQHHLAKMMLVQRTIGQ